MGDVETLACRLRPLLDEVADGHQLAQIIFGVDVGVEVADGSQPNHTNPLFHHLSLQLWCRPVISN